MTSVWPALWPPWKRTTMSACSDNQSTILPFPSSPHWAPTTTTLAIRGYSLCNHQKHEHDLPGKSGVQSEIMHPAKITAGAARMRGTQPDKGSGVWTQAKRRLSPDRNQVQAFDIP